MAYNDIDSGKVLNKEGLLELSGQIKGYIEDNIPQAYTLPTATTSTLGGVKVDGETITINDGVISAVGGGDTTKIINVTTLANILEDEALDTALQEIQTALRNNGTVEYIVYLDNILATPVANSNNTYPKLRVLKNGKFLDYTPASANEQVFYYSTTNYALDSSNVSVPTANQIGSKSNVAETIGYIKTNYATKDYVDVKVPDISTTATDGVYKLTSTVTSGTATFSWEEDTGGSGSGGATYTAGAGISIDGDNVISNTIQDTGTGVILGMILSTLGNNDGNYVFAFSDSITDGDQAIGCLLSHKVINTTYSTRGITLTTANKNTYRNKIGASQDETITQFVISNNGTITIYPLSNAFIPASSFTFAICSGRVIISIYYNRTTHRFANLPSLRGFPTAPTTDGDYILKVSVSSGTPTYSWVSATTGGSY